MMTEAREAALAEDLLQWIYRNYVHEIGFDFYHPSTSTRVHAIRYSITRTWAGDEDDLSGGLRYADVAGTEFRVILKPNESWAALPSGDQQTFYGTLNLAWGDNTLTLNDAGGVWTTDRMYGSGQLGATRSVFRR